MPLWDEALHERFESSTTPSASFDKSFCDETYLSNGLGDAQVISSLPLHGFLLLLQVSQEVDDTGRRGDGINNAVTLTCSKSQDCVPGLHGSRGNSSNLLYSKQDQFPRTVEPYVHSSWGCLRNTDWTHNHQNRHIACFPQGRRKGKKRRLPLAADHQACLLRCPRLWRIPVFSLSKTGLAAASLSFPNSLQFICSIHGHWCFLSRKMSILLSFGKSNWALNSTVKVNMYSLWQWCTIESILIVNQLSF